MAVNCGRILVKYFRVLEEEKRLNGESSSSVPLVSGNYLL